MPGNNLQSQVSPALDAVPSKIVRADDLTTFVQAFAKTEHYNIADALILQGEAQQVLKQAVADHGKGVYVGKDQTGAPGVFVDLKFVTQTLETLAGKMNGSPFSASIAKVDNTIAEALNTSKDQSAGLKTGAIKPLAMK